MVVAGDNFRTSYLPNLPKVLSGDSLAVTTYHASKLALIRSNQDGVIDTHYTNFQKPTGLTVCGDKLAVACETELIELESTGGRYSKVQIHTTGAQLAHDLVYQGDHLIYVNTLRSCICDAGGGYVWSPNFMQSRTNAGDHCHLNGLCTVDGSPRWATAHASVRNDGGWRNHKNNGVLIDMNNGEVILDGLSMPHSPRWYEGNLWICESGTGTIGIIDLKTRRYEPVAVLEGFTRGLCFRGNLAFVGLSQARDSLFADCDLKKRTKNLYCGVYVVDVVTGQLVSGIRLHDPFQEVFAVELINHAWPEVD